MNRKSNPKSSITCRALLVARYAILSLVFTTVLVFDASANQEESHTQAIDRLVEHFSDRNVDLLAYLGHPEFRIYKEITERFTKSPERTAGNAYIEALKKGDKAAAEKVFADQYEQYKRRAGFEHKRRNIGQFMKNYSSRLAAASELYGIPGEVIAAIIGVESDFGVNTGRYNPFNVYVSMYIADYRSSFALNQLTELISFVERTGMDVFTMRSSYAGAIGYMQFIPYSLNRWFVGNDVLDMNDNIDSVANYLSHFKKSRGNLEDAIHAYNPSRFYVRLVMDLAEAGKRD